MLDFLYTIIYVPLYNGLIFLVDKVPGHDVGIAVILLTIVVRIVLFPLSKRAVESQLAMKKVAPEVEQLKKKHKDNPVEQNKAIMALYKERGIRPFSGFGLLLLQLPILIALYYMFTHGGLPEIKSEILYSFVSAPESVDMQFLGFIDMSAAHNIVLAILVAISQFLYTRISMGSTAKQESAVEASLSNDLAKSFDFQARYVMPVIIGTVGYFFPAVASLYLVTANIFMIGQEFLSGRRF
ncbi:membrane protein insertase YidC [Candidatus Parcubacteria bacterium]|nr:MAG: membrane protein insertase YidC [Candidatus Parcubacteria bacterium]